MCSLLTNKKKINAQKIPLKKKEIPEFVPKKPLPVAQLLRPHPEVWGLLKFESWGKETPNSPSGAVGVAWQGACLRYKGLNSVTSIHINWLEVVKRSRSPSAT